MKMPIAFLFIAFFSIALNVEAQISDTTAKEYSNYGEHYMKQERLSFSFNSLKSPYRRLKTTEGVF